MSEVEPKPRVARRRSDHRQHVGQTGAPSEPGRWVKPFGEREDSLAELLRPIERLGRGGSSRAANSAPVVRRSPRAIGVTRYPFSKSSTGRVSPACRRGAKCM